MRDFEKEVDAYEKVSAYGIATTQWFKSVSSTMDEARSLVAGGAALPALVGATSQSGGRGRSGKVWVEPKIGLYVTYVLSTTLPSYIFNGYTVSLGAHLALKLSDIIKRDIFIKWPNDLLVRSEQDTAWLKVGGILVESCESPLSQKAVFLIGVGLNIHGASPDAPQAGALGDIAHQKYEPEDFLDPLTSAVTETFERYERRGGSKHQAIPFYEDAEKLLMLKGQAIEINVGERNLVGTCVGLAKSGALKLTSSSSAEPHEVSSGTVVVWDRN